MRSVDEVDAESGNDESDESHGMIEKELLDALGRGLVHEVVKSFQGILETLQRPSPLGSSLIS